MLTNIYINLGLLLSRPASDAALAFRLVIIYLSWFFFEKQKIIRNYNI